MTGARYFLTSLTRISDLDSVDFTIEPLERYEWRLGDYAAVELIDPASGRLQIELTNGRHIGIMPGDRLIGALGSRYATLESTGSWEFAGPDGRLDVLTGAGLLGRLTSRSIYVPSAIEGMYLGHVLVGGQRRAMTDYAPRLPARPLPMPVVLVVGTSMSAGKTTAGAVVIRQLRRIGLHVLGAKLTGAGRYKDILAFQDSGAEAIFDFVDAGLPSTVCPPDDYLPALDTLLHLLAGAPADVAVIEIGASPLEPYNGDLAVQAIAPNIRLTILCASDPYAVVGLTHSFGLQPDLVSGPAANTLAGRDLVKKLCGVRALHLIDPDSLPELRRLLREKLRG